MEIAIKEAKKAYAKNEVPIGAVIVQNNKVISKAHNQREGLNKAIAHAEVLAIEEANEVINSWRLDSCTLYVTIEPCLMCAGAIIQSRIQNVVYGASDPKAGVHKSVLKVFETPFNHKVNIKGGVLEQECSELMSTFFKKLRSK